MQKQDRPVAFFDSGLGGISVLRETVRLLPQENYLYYGDSLHAPYGVKSEAQIQALSLAAAEHLVSAGAKAIVAWGTCASWGCVQAARPNPTQATPIHKVIHDKPIIKVPGCPAIPDVMSNIVAYILTYDQIPKLDSQGRPEVFYGKRVHDQCVRRAHFDAGQFVESWDDAAASLGYCLYKMGCKGPTTYNACPVTRWNNGVSYPIQSGHGCIGCAEQNFWDHGSFYSRITNIPQFGTNTTAETVGVAAVAGIGAGVVTHAAISTAVHLKHRYGKDGDCSKETKTAQAEKTASNDSTPSERN